MKDVKYVLAVSGGGIYGMIPASILSTISGVLGEIPAFDMVAGTSTGAIVAAGVNQGIDPNDLMSLYMDRGKDIFNRSLSHKINSLWGIRGPKYQARGLDKVMEDVFGQEWFTNSREYGRLLILAYDAGVAYQNVVVLDNQDYFTDRLVYLRELVSASCRAPTFFRPHKLSGKFTANPMSALIDGGFVANNPSLYAYLAAKKEWPDSEIRVLSLGTGMISRAIKYKRVDWWGLLNWARLSFYMMMDGQMDSTKNHMNNLLGENFWHIDIRLDSDTGGMDDVSEKNLSNIHRLCNQFAKQFTGDEEKISRLNRFFNQGLTSENDSL